MKKQILFLIMFLLMLQTNWAQINQQLKTKEYTDINKLWLSQKK